MPPATELTDDLTDFVRAVAAARGIAIKPEWVADVALHLKRLLDAAQLLEQSDMVSDELAPRFEP